MMMDTLAESITTKHGHTFQQGHSMDITMFAVDIKPQTKTKITAPMGVKTLQRLSRTYRNGVDSREIYSSESGQCDTKSIYDGTETIQMSKVGYPRVTVTALGTST